MIKQLKQYQVSLIPFDAVKNWSLNNIDNENVLLFESTGSDDGSPIEFEYLDFETGVLTVGADCNIALEIQDGDKVLYREGIKSIGSFYPDTEPLNDDGTFKRIVYSQIKNTFYNDYRNITQILGVENIDVENGKTKRRIDDRFRLFDIPKNIFGDKILPNSVTIYDTSLNNNHTIMDDGNGNLYAQSNIFTNEQEIGNFDNYFYNGHDYTCCVSLGICP